MKKVLALFVLLLPVATFAQFTPSKAQHEKLAKQKAKIVNIQLEIARLQAEMVFEVGNLERICREVALANRWPAEVGCNPQSLTFTAASSSEAAASAGRPQPPPHYSPEDVKPGTTVLQPAPPAEQKKP